MKGKYASKIEEAVEAFNIPQNNIAREIDIDLLDENPDNEQVFGMNDIDIIAEDMKHEQFHGAITVFDKQDGRYEISSGHRRYRAAKMAHKKTILCIVYPYPASDKDRSLMLLLSNSRNRVYTPLGWARMIQYFETTQGEDRPEGMKMREYSAKFFNMSPAKVSRYKQLLSLSPSLQSLADRIDFPYIALLKAANLSMDEQERLYSELVKLDDVSGNDIDRNIKKITNTITANSTLVPKKNIDGFLKITGKQLNDLINHDYIIQDRVIVKQYIDRIKSLIQEIEEQL